MEDKELEELKNITGADWFNAYKQLRIKMGEDRLKELEKLTKGE